MLVWDGLYWAFGLTTSMGGFSGSGSVSLWAFMAPLAATLLAGVRSGVKWLIALMVAVLGLAALEFSGMLAGMPEVSLSAQRVFIVMNIVGVFLLSFVAMTYYARLISAQEREALNQAWIMGDIIDNTKAVAKKIEAAARQLTSVSESQAM